VCAIGHAVEEKIGQRIAREAPRVRRLRRKHEARSGDALRFGIIAQALVRLGRIIEQPEDAVLRLAQDVEPALE